MARTHDTGQTHQPEAKIPTHHKRTGFVGGTKKMSNIGKPERETQERVAAFFVERLGYRSEITDKLAIVADEAKRCVQTFVRCRSVL